MKKKLFGAFDTIITVSLLSCCILSSCSGNGGNQVDLEALPKEIELSGKPVDLSDSIPRIIGNAAVTDNGYILYQYDSPYYLLATDKNFKPIKDFAPKGNGPGEVNNVSSLMGQSIENGLLTVFDSNARNKKNVRSKSPEWIRA